MFKWNTAGNSQDMAELFKWNTAGNSQDTAGCSATLDVTSIALSERWKYNCHSAPSEANLSPDTLIPALYFFCIKVANQLLGKFAVEP